MKQDSYVRFLKSDLYKECVVGEVEGRPLPHSEVEDEEWEDDNANIDKVKQTYFCLIVNHSTVNSCSCNCNIYVCNLLIDHEKVQIYIKHRRSC